MDRSRWALLCVFIAFGGRVLAADDVRVIVEEVPDVPSAQMSPFSANVLSNFPADVKFTLEALYPARNNSAQQPVQGEKDPALRLYRYLDRRACHTLLHHSRRSGRPRELGWPFRPASGRPAGSNVPSAGWVESDGYFRSTYHASEIGGVVDVTVHCRSFTTCRDSRATFGVGVQGLEDLGPGIGYVLTGDKQQHPSNHWGVPNFLAAVSSVATQFVEVYPDTPLLYNDISLEYGGVFDVQTRTSTGYDWTPPHDTHRLGKNMDIGVPRGHRQREKAVELFESASVHVFKEDPYHWHLSY